jgi:cell division protein ZapE
LGNGMAEASTGNGSAAAATPIERYRALRRAGELKPDPEQELAIEKLEILHHRIAQYRPDNANGWLSFLRRRPKREPAPEGLYLYGDVGRGKSMLMDLFFETVPLENKRRVHFHAFMADVHKRINAFRRTPESERDGDDPIPPVARDIAQEIWLLCFDEFEVRDVADAMILGRLFTQLFENGVVVVATSNREPDTLYEGGLNRQLFLPFIALLKERLDVLCINGRTDYRLDRLRGLPVYHTPLDDAAARALDNAFYSLTDTQHGEPDEVEVMGRTVRVPEQARGVARFSFDDLCAQPLAANDYLALAQRYHTIILSGIPKLSAAKRNEARRFVLLIDVLYDNGVKLIASAEVPVDEIYAEGDGTFEFQRTVSRLMEMQSSDYIDAPHA